MSFYEACRDICDEDEPLLSTIEGIQKSLRATAQYHFEGRLEDSCKGFNIDILEEDTTGYSTLLQAYPFMVTLRVESSQAWIK